MLQAISMTNIITIIFNILFTGISVFFLMRITTFLIEIMTVVRRKKLWTIILFVVIAFGNFWLYCADPIIQMIKIKKINIYWLLDAIGSGAITIAVLIGMLNAVAQIKLKTKRQREYERAVSGKQKNYAVFVILCGIAFVSCIISAIYSKVVENNTKSMITYLIIAGISLILGICLALATIKNNKIKDEADNKIIKPQNNYFTQERVCVLIIEDNKGHYLYKGTHKGPMKLEEYVGNLTEYYYIQVYGVLKFKDTEYDLFGFKTTSLDKTLLSEIKMEKFESKEVEAILPYLQKNRSKVFELDDDLNPIESFDA